VAEDVEREQNGGIECVECSFNGIGAAFRVTARRETDLSSSTTTIVVESLI